MKTKKIKLNDKDFDMFFNMTARSMIANPSSKQRVKMINGLFDGKYNKIQLDEESWLDIKERTLIVKEGINNENIL